MIKKILVALLVWSITSHGIHMSVSSERIQKALAIPAQSSLEREQSWSCGPNALARYFVLLGYDFEHDKIDRYADFVASCPRSCGQPTTTQGYLSCAALALGGCASIALGDNGTSDMLGMFAIAASTSPFVMEAINACAGAGKVGPTPKWLVGFANKYLKAHQRDHVLSTVHGDDRKRVLDGLQWEIRNGRPVIVLLNYSPLVWHYITLTGYDEETNTFTYLNSNKTKNTITANDLADAMDFDKNRYIKSIKALLFYAGGWLEVDIDRFNYVICRSTSDERDFVQ